MAMPYDPAALVQAPPSAVSTGKSKPRKAPRSPVQTGAASFTLELRVIRGTKLADDDPRLSFLIRVGVHPGDAINTTEQVRHPTKQRNISITVKRWRVRIKNAKLIYPVDTLSALATDAGKLGFSVYYAGLDNTQKRFVVSPFAMGAGPDLQAKHSPASLRRARFNATHKPADAQARLLSELQQASVWAIGERLPQDFADDLPNWLMIHAKWLAQCKLVGKDRAITACEDLASFAPNSQELLEHALHLQANHPYIPEPASNPVTNSGFTRIDNGRKDKRLSAAADKHAYRNWLASRVRFNPSSY